MRVTFLFAGSALILLILTGLSLLDLWKQELVLRQISEASVSHEAASNELHSAVLQARAGLLRDYDAIVAASDRSMASLQAIEALGERMPAFTDAVTIASEQQQQQLMLIEQFKSENALLQNSLVYFSALSKGFQESLNNETPLKMTIGEVVTSMLAFTLDPSGDNAKILQAGVAELRGAEGDPSQARSRDNLVAHAQLVLSILPGVDHLVRSILSGTDAKRIVGEALTVAVGRHASLTRAYLGAFSIAAALAAAACVAIGFQLRTKMQTIRARKELDTIIADMMLHSINANTSQLNAIIEKALQRVADWARADRARYVSAGFPAVSFDSVPKSSRGPSEFLEQFALQHTGHEFIYLRRGQREVDPELSRALLSAKVSTWFCYRSAESRRGSLLTLERYQGRFRYGEDVLNLLRGPLDAISNAIDRVIQKNEQRALEARLNQAQRLEAVGTFASGIAHNLNNITTAIRGHAEMAGEVRHGAALDRHLNEIIKAADRAHDVVSEIMAFGRPGHLVRSKTNISALVRNAVHLLSANVPKSVKLECDITEEVFATVDAQQIEQVLLNLVRNAWQAIGTDDGVVRIDLKCRRLVGTLELSHGAVEPGRYLVLSVIDNGSGMTQDVQDRIFEPFFSTRETGNGLGLATVKRIVATHQGTLDVRSEIGRGSTVSVWLPVESSDATEDSATVTEGSGERILLIGSNGAERLKIEETVAALGYEPISFSERDPILDLISPASVDAVLLLTHPGNSSKHLAMLRASGARLPIVVVATAEAMPEIDDDAGVVDVLCRPLIPAVLAVSLAKAIRFGGHSSAGRGRASRPPAAQ